MKRAFGFLLLLAVLFAITGCGGNDKSAKPADGKLPPPPPGPTGPKTKTGPPTAPKGAD